MGGVCLAVCLAVIAASSSTAEVIPWDLMWKAKRVSPKTTVKCGSQAFATPDHHDTANLRGPRIYIYDYPPLNAFLREVKAKYIANPMPTADKYYTEIALHERLLSSRLRTRDPTEADIFFIPFYGTYAFDTGGIMALTKLHNLLYDLFSKNTEATHFLSRHGGSDHAIVYSSTRGFGNRATLFPKRFTTLLGHTVILTVEVDDYRFTKDWDPRGRWDQSYRRLVHENGVLIPFYTAAVTHGAAFDIVSHNPSEISVAMIANPRHPIRARLMQVFARWNEEIIDGTTPIMAQRSFVRNNNATDTRFNIARYEVPRGQMISTDDFTRLQQESAAILARSTFCLIPCGTTPTTTRLYEALASLCIPVIVCDAASRFPFQRQIDYNRIALRFTEACVDAVPRALASMTEATIRAYRDAIERARKHLLWHHPASETVERIAMELERKRRTRAADCAGGKVGFFRLHC